MTISQYYTPEERQKIISANVTEYFCTWRNAKGESKEKRSNTPESLYFYEQHYGAVIYIDTKYEAKKRLQRIIRAVNNETKKNN